MRLQSRTEGAWFQGSCAVNRVATPKELYTRPQGLSGEHKVFPLKQSVRYQYQPYILGMDHERTCP